MKVFAGTPRKLDLLFWLGYRLHTLSEPLKISWDALKEQWGQGHSHIYWLPEGVDGWCDWDGPVARAVPEPVGP